MKRLFIIAGLCISCLSYGQFTVTSDANTGETPSITIYLSGFNNQSNINALATASRVKKDAIVFQLMAANNPVFSSAGVSIQNSFVTRDSRLKLDVIGLSKKDLVKLNTLESQLYLSMDKPLNLIMKKDPLDSVAQVETIKVEDMESGSLGQIIIPEKVIDAYLEGFGGEFAFAQNSFSYGFTPASASDIDEMELYADFSFRKKYGNGKWLLYTKGRVSTNDKDTLNYIYFYPVNYSFWSSKEATTEFIGQLGMESNQTFSSGRVAFNFNLQSIIPNLIDLTMGNDRLRLKPIIGVGIKGYQEFDNLRVGASNEFSLQANANLYYNIPLFDYYNIILESTGYYDFNSDVNVDDTVKFNYSIALTARVPNTALTTLFKYKDGQIDVNNLSDSNLTIGLVADFQSLLMGKN